MRTLGGRDGSNLSRWHEVGAHHWRDSVRPLGPWNVVDPGNRRLCVVVELCNAERDEKHVLRPTAPIVRWKYQYYSFTCRNSGPLPLAELSVRLSVRTLWVAPLLAPLL